MLSTRSNPPITFAVDNVTPATTPLKTCKPMEAVRSLLDAPDARFAPDESSQGNPTHGRVEACWSYSLDCVAEVKNHPLIVAAHIAFAEHRPLILTPDIIWLTIAQGLVQHVRLDPEKYRSQFVSHKGKRELTVMREDVYRGSPENPWAEVVADFAKILHEEVGEFAERFVCDFSTTGPLERMVSEVALMDLLLPYYSFHLVCACGIPSITLEGTPEDWKQLREKVNLLEPFDMDWWLDELKPICDQFVQASQGNADNEHWQRIYKIRTVYGASLINGWLGKLFPYLRDYETKAYTCRNPLLDPAVEKEIRELEAEESKKGFDFMRRRFDPAPGITSEELPRGISQVSFTLSDHRGKIGMELVAGAVAITQDPRTLALKPLLGWAVREAAPIEQALIRLSDHKTEPSETTPSYELLRSLRMEYAPSDLLRFFQEVSSATIHEGIYRILPLEMWSEPNWAEGWLNSKGKKRHWPEMYRFTELADGTELVIWISSPSFPQTGKVMIGQRNGKETPETGKIIARSFTDFLLQALAHKDEPYFRRDDFVPISEEELFGKKT